MSGVESIVVVLSRGRHPIQPMTCGWFDGTAQEVFDEVAGLAESLARHGEAPVRIKLEAVPTCEGIPHSDRDAARMPPSCYFEQHLLVAVADDDDLAHLDEYCSAREAYLSITPRCLDVDGSARWRYVTLRQRGIGRDKAARRLRAFTRDLRHSGRRPARSYWEFVACDTNEALDEGWVRQQEDR